MDKKGGIGAAGKGLWNIVKYLATRGTGAANPNYAAARAAGQATKQGVKDLGAAATQKVKDVGSAADARYSDPSFYNPIKSFKDHLRTAPDAAGKTKQRWGKTVAGGVAVPTVGGGAYALGQDINMNLDIPGGRQSPSDRTPMAPELLDRMAEVGEHGQTSSAPNQTMMQAFNSMPAGKRAAIGFVLMGLSGLAGSKAYGAITGKKNLNRDIAATIGSGTVGGIAGALSKDASEEAHMDGLYTGYKRY
jgi:hypothetical protein